MKERLRYIRKILEVLWDVAKDEYACFRVDVHNFLIRFRKKPKQKEFEESDPYFEPYKNDNV